MDLRTNCRNNYRISSKFGMVYAKPQN
jgi:hypothetical protein